MDIIKTLRELHREKKRLDSAIASLETRVKHSVQPIRPGRGRKSMKAEERLAVSERMKSYWRARRESSALLDNPPGPAAPTS